MDEKEKNQNLQNTSTTDTSSNQQDDFDPDSLFFKFELDDQGISAEDAQKLEEAAKKGEDLDEEELAPEDKKVIEEIVNKKVAPLQEKIFKEKRELEIEKFLSSEEGKFFAEYRERIKKLAFHPKFKDLKVDALAALAAGKDLPKIAAKIKESEEKDKLGGGSSPGLSKSQTEGGLPKPAWEMSKEEFRAFVQKIMARGD